MKHKQAFLGPRSMSPKALNDLRAQSLSQEPLEAHIHPSPLSQTENLSMSFDAFLHIWKLILAFTKSDIQVFLDIN